MKCACNVGGGCIGLCLGSSRSFWIRCSIFLGVVCLITLLLASGVTLQAQTPWKLVWSDEFDGPIGAPPDVTKWAFQTGPGAAISGNDEAEIYCSPFSSTSPAPCSPNQPNAYLDGKGHLVLVAVRSDQTVTVGAKKIVSPVYTSARMKSIQTFRYGRIEASIRIPVAGKGVWPAFWALGEPSDAVHWPSTGEIDIMEQWNPQPAFTDKIDPLTIHGAVHGPKEPGSVEGYIDRTGNYVFPRPPSEGLHQYAAEWDPGEVDFYVDGYLYSRQSVGTMTGKEVWEQDRGPFSILLNLAMGGGFFGYPDATTSPTPTLVVDYVRLYQRDEQALPSGWGNYDVGGPSEAGNSKFGNGVYTVAGGGFGIAGHFDQFQFAYKALSGDGEVSAHVLNQSSKVLQAKAGVMLRSDRGAASAFAMVFVSPDASVHFRFRNKIGELPGDVLYKGPATWVKVGRHGNIFTGFVSPDGKSWTAIGNAGLTMPSNVLAGLIATSRDNRTPNVVQFDFVDVTRSNAAWDGYATILPGVIQAENFDTGGPGWSFSPEFKSTASTYRTDGPQIEPIRSQTAPDSVAGGYYLTELQANRWINYSVRIEQEGNYVITARVASAGTGGTFHFNLDQKPLSRPMQIPDTGGDQQWKDLSFAATHLPAGDHTIALVIDSTPSSKKAGNIDYFSVRSQ